MNRSVEFKRSFDRLYQKLNDSEKTKVRSVLDRFLSTLEENRAPAGLGLKRLKKDIWEIRVDIHLRVSFRMQKNRIEFGVVGNHEDIKRYLKNFR